MTLTAPSGPLSVPEPPPPARRRQPAETARRTRPRRISSPMGWLYLLVVTVTVFQRFVVPGTVVSIALPVAFGVVIALGIGGHVVADASRTVLYAVAAAGCCVASLLASMWGGLELSISSLALLLVVYLPCCARVRPELRQRFPELLTFFQRLMVVAAVACVGQWAAQAVGWQFEDLLKPLPPGLLVATTDYNLSNPIYYGSSIFKSNGIVFLEASFASQFLALAIIIEILLGRSRWRLILFGAALLTTVSGTGLVLLAFGLLVLAGRRGGRWATRAGAAVLVAVVVVSATPAGALLADRSTETSQNGSSGNARFVAPYEQVVAALSADTPALLVGRGAGAVSNDEAFFNPLGIEANYPAVPKLLGEYGLPATLLFLAFLLALFLARVPSPTLGLMACMLLFVLSGALLQPQTVYLVWLLTGLFGLPMARGAPPRPKLRSVCPAATAQRVRS